MTTSNSTGDEKKSSEVHGFHLQPQVLAICQQMLKEGWSILYGENTLSVNTFCPNTSLTTSWHCPCGPPGDMSRLINDLFAIVLGEHFLSKVPFHSDWKDGKALLGIVARFDKARVTVEAECHTWKLHILREVLQVIQTSMCLKSIEVTIIQPSTACKKLDHYLKVFLALRCTHFKFIGLDNNVASEVEQVVMSTLPELNCAKMYFRTVNLLTILSTLRKFECPEEPYQLAQKQFDTYHKTVLEIVNDVAPSDFLEARSLLTDLVDKVVKLTAEIMELELHKDDDDVSQVVIWNELHRDGRGQGAVTQQDPMQGRWARLKEEMRE